jgi:pimeloyl-ACP methyl ester carboxylesterase
MSTFVLVHGAWHDGSCWERVVERLNHLGHWAFSPTVAGYGRDVRHGITHAESARSVVDFIVDHALTNIVLVGHSSGGAIISKVAEQIPERIRRLVFLCAFVLKDGESVLAALPPGGRAIMTRLAAESTDNTVTLPFQLWRDNFINDADLATARWTYDRLSPQPFPPMLEPLNLKKFHTLSTPKSYLMCTGDTTMPQGEWSRRLGAHRLIQMRGSHEVIFTNPLGLVDKLIAAVRD